MTAPAVPLDNLAQRIAQQQSELDTLRQEYDRRQARLTELNRRKKDLQAELQQIQGEIQAVDRGQTPSAPSSKAAPRPASVATSPANTYKAQTLSGFLMTLVRQAQGPVTVKELAKEFVRQKYPTTSGNIPQLVKSALHKLVVRGVLRQPKGQRGTFALAAASNGKPAPAAQATGKSAKGPEKQHKQSPKAATLSGSKAPKLALGPLLISLLAKSSRPLTAEELAERALAQGYQTQSKSFKNVIWVMMGKIDNAENVPGKGYRLKKR